MSSSSDPLLRAEEFIWANAGADITVADIAGAVGVSPRWLQVTFKQQRHTTPTRYLRMVRLEQARQELERDDEDVRVTDVATRWGFYNPGRFSAYYLEAYGTQPHTARRRSRAPVNEPPAPRMPWDVQNTGEARLRA